MNARDEQLRKQIELDEKLKACPCKTTVNEYLFERRKINREQYTHVKEGGFLNIYKNIQRNLDEVASDQKRLHHVLSSENPCNELEKYLDDIRDK